MSAHVKDKIRRVLLSGVARTDHKQVACDVPQSRNLLFFFLQSSLRPRVQCEVATGRALAHLDVQGCGRRRRSEVERSHRQHVSDLSSASSVLRSRKAREIVEVVSTSAFSLALREKKPRTIEPHHCECVRRGQLSAPATATAESDVAPPSSRKAREIVEFVSTSAFSLAFREKARGPPAHHSIHECFNPGQLESRKASEIVGVVTTSAFSLAFRETRRRASGLVAWGVRRSSGGCRGVRGRTRGRWSRP
jgi:hypothetical protein